MACRHEHPRGLTWDDGIGWMTGGDDAHICRRCGEWLSLGPATHDRCAVEDEIAAAKFVQNVGADRARRLLRKPRACLQGGRPACERTGCDGCDIWDLARAIATHDTEHKP